MLFKAEVVTLWTFVEYFIAIPETKWLSHSSCNHVRVCIYVERGFVACKTIIFVASLWTIVERYKCTALVHFSTWKIYFTNERKLSLLLTVVFNSCKLQLACSIVPHVLHVLHQIPINNSLVHNPNVYKKTLNRTGLKCSQN